MNKLETLLKEEQAFHDRHAPDYLAHITNPRNKELIRLRSKVFLKQMKPGVRTLELGAGVGTWSRHFSGSVPLVSLDFSRESLILLGRNAPGALRVQADVRHLPFFPGTFKQIFVGMVLHHLPYETRSNALAEILRVMSPGARLIMHEPNRAIRRSLFLAVRNMKKWAPFRILFKFFRADYDHAESSPIDQAIGRQDEDVSQSGIEPQGFIEDELIRFFSEHGLRVRKVEYFHSIQLPTPKWFGGWANRLVVGMLHIFERVFLRRASGLSHFLYLVADKTAESAE